MADYESDSSDAGDIATDVLLGYASKEPTVDEFSRLGGHPFWLDDKTSPSGTLAKCSVCNGLMNLLLQVYGDLPDQFAGHERRLYLFACRRKACRRKAGSVRGFRATRQTNVQSTSIPTDSVKEVVKDVEPKGPSKLQSPVNLGETLFGVKPTSPTQANPFSMSSNSGSLSNPFATASSLAAKPAQKPSHAETLPETFAKKVKISTPELPPTPPSIPYEEWPPATSFPEPYPQYYLDADKEYIDAAPQPLPSGVRVESGTTEGDSSSAAEDRAAFESSMDKTFQRFADRLAQNPEQVLRYEFGGQPLLYSKTDAVGKLLGPAQEHTNANAKVKAKMLSGSRMPRCTNCGAERVFELQLTPQVITELEVDEMSVDGMDWGTIILGVCSQDCVERGKGKNDVSYAEEWTGVQWEEIVRNDLRS